MITPKTRPFPIVQKNRPWSLLAHVATFQEVTGRLQRQSFHSLHTPSKVQHTRGRSKKGSITINFLPASGILANIRDHVIHTLVNFKTSAARNIFLAPIQCLQMKLSEYPSIFT